VANNWIPISSRDELENPPKPDRFLLSRPQTPCPKAGLQEDVSAIAVLFNLHNEDILVNKVPDTMLNGIECFLGDWKIGVSLQRSICRIMPGNNPIRIEWSIDIIN